ARPATAGLSYFGLGRRGSGLNDVLARTCPDETGAALLPVLHPVKISISLRGPVAPTSRTSRVAAPCPATRGAREFAGAGGVFVLNGYRSANRAGFRDVSSKLHQVRVCHNPV